MVDPRFNRLEDKMKLRVAAVSQDKSQVAPPFLWIKTVVDDVILLGCSPSQSNELQSFNRSTDDNLKFVLKDLVLGSLRLK